MKLYQVITYDGEGNIQLVSDDAWENPEDAKRSKWSHDKDLPVSFVGWYHKIKELNFVGKG